MTQLVRTTTTLTYAGAQRAIAAASAHAEAIGVPVNIAVADTAGNLIAFARMDGAALMSGPIAQDKAYTVAAFNGLPTHGWLDVLGTDEALKHGIVHRDRLVIFAGGVPVRINNELVGAVGVSGGSAEQDREIAEAGAEALA